MVFWFYDVDSVMLLYCHLVLCTATALAGGGMRVRRVSDAMVASLIHKKSPIVVVRQAPNQIVWPPYGLPIGMYAHNKS